MNDLLIYLLKVSAGLGIICIPYYFLIRNDPNLVIKRFYLLSGIIASWVFPFITFRKLPLVVDLTPTVFIDLDTPAVSTSLIETAGSSAGISINWIKVLLLVYLAGFTFLFLKNLFIIIKWNLTWRHAKNGEGVAFIRNDQVFTLFTRIFVPSSMKTDQDLNNILLHEQAHIRQLHFIDLMAIELTLLLTWFNPFSWLISRMIKENHEHLADRYVLSAGVNPARYRAQLMNHTLGVNVFRLGNQFNHSLTLNRFKMMKKPSRSPLGIFKIALLIPLVLITLGLTTGMTPQQKTVEGKVVFADTGEPAIGASVVVRNSTLGCVVDTDGTFMLNVDGNPELVISFVGYSTLIVKASDIGKKPLQLEVKTYTMDLESIPLEVKREITGSISLRLSDGEEAQPVFVLDGERVVDGIDNLDPGQIESISVIKDPNDPLVKKYNAKDGLILIITKDQQEEEVLYQEQEVFYIVENMPTFNGGDAAQEFRKYIAENLRYPESAKKSGISGRVIVQFAVDKRGNVVDAVVVRAVDPALDKEAIRVVQSSPKWTPGTQRGKPVKVLFTFPINFVVDDQLKDNEEETNEVFEKYLPPKDNKEIFYVVEDMPKFPGGLPALKTYIYSNLEYPENAKNQGIEGEVIVRFLINSKGEAVNGEVLRSTYQGFDEPALKVIREMPDWTPGMQRGKPVQVRYVMSIKFNDDMK